MEKEFVRWLVDRIKTAPRRAGMVVDLGDDAAVINGGSFIDGELVIATDSIAAGTHFDLATPLEDVGRKAIAVNMSDLAAMAARPIAATLAITVPKSFGLDELKKLYLGAEAACHEYGAIIIGGDTNSWSGQLVVSVTLIGTPIVSGKTWPMSGGKPGDCVFVSGRLGGSILGHHLRFEPRLALARNLVESCEVNAATDVSDSLTMDLDSLARASHAGACLDLTAVPVSDDANELSQTSGVSALDHALYDGEDFQLLFTVDPAVADRIQSDSSIAEQVTQIGRLTSNLGLWSAKFPDEPIPVRGYEH